VSLFSAYKDCWDFLTCEIFRRNLLQEIDQKLAMKRLAQSFAHFDQVYEVERVVELIFIRFL
jgi:hypothetical protein